MTSLNCQITRKSLDNMLKPYTKVLKLNARYFPDRAKLILSNLAILSPILVNGGAKKTDSLEPYLKWQSRYGKSDGVEVKYRVKGDSYGRFYPSGSGSGYVGVTRPVRHYLAHDTYTDIDIDNCHPIMIEQLFPIVTGKSSVALNWWNTNRDNIFKQIIAENPRLTRDDCKTIAYTFLYGGNMQHRFKDLGLAPAVAPESIYQQCKGLCTEMEMFSVGISNLYPEVWESISQPKDASKLSIIIQHIERHVALIMVERALKMNLEVGDVCHDGLFLASNGKPLDDETIQEFKADAIREIQLETGFKLNLSVKTMTIPPWASMLTSCSESEYSQSFLDTVDKFEQTHAKVIAKSKFLVVTTDGYDLKTRTDMLSTYEHMYYLNKDKKKTPFIRDWLKYEFQKCYTDIGIYPPGVECPEGWFNAWRPFSAELMSSRGSDTSEDVSLILNHIKVLCNHEEPVYEYFIGWIGHMLKYPAVKSKCITLISKQGAGKGTLIDMLKRLIGAFRVLSTSKPSREVWGMFNGQMEHAFLVNLDELSKKETVDSLGEIKKLITDDTLTISRKGVGQYDIRSFHRFIVTTNNEDPIRSDSDDRRNLIIRSSDEFCPCVMGAEASGEYFTKLRKSMDKDDVIVALYNYFTELPDLDKFNSKPIPSTEQQEALKEMSRSDIEMWLEYFVQVTEGESHKMMSSDAYESYKMWCSINKKECYYNNVQFAIRLRLLRVVGVETGIKTKNGNAIKFDLVNLRNQFGLIDGLVLDD